jgi:hypothetical protein
MAQLVGLRVYGLGWRAVHRFVPITQRVTNQKVAGSIADGVKEFFIDINPDRTVALGSTQPLTEMSTGSISWGVNAAGA